MLRFPQLKHLKFDVVKQRDHVETRIIAEIRKIKNSIHKVHPWVVFFNGYHVLDIVWDILPRFPKFQSWVFQHMCHFGDPPNFLEIFIPHTRYIILHFQFNPHVHRPNIRVR